MDVAELRAQWNQVLDLLEARDRIAWLVFFDARLAHLENNVLTLDFSDARKFASSHEYEAIRLKHKEALASAIHDIFKVDLIIDELR